MSLKKEENLSDTLLNRRQFIHATAAVAGGGLLVACGGSEPTKLTQLTAVPTMPPVQATATVRTMIGKTYFPSDNPDLVPDAFTAPLPLRQSVHFVPGRGGAVSVFNLTNNPPVRAKGQNKFWQALEKRLNVTWNVILAPGSDVYKEKIATLLASGNLPDLVRVETATAPVLLQALQEGAFLDLSSYLTGNALNDYPNLARLVPKAAWNNIKVNGILYGVPRVSSWPGAVLIYRRDWAQKVGIPNPRDPDEFFELLKAFTFGDPDGNGKNDTWGSAFAKTIDMQSFMTMFGVPTLWRKNADGSFTYYIETDEYRQGLDYVRRVYAGGLFYPDSVSQTNLQQKENFFAGKYGMYTAGFPEIVTARQRCRSINPRADAAVLTPPAAPGRKTNVWWGTAYSGYVAIPSSVKDPERVKELLRILDYLAASQFTYEGNFLTFGLDGQDNSTQNGLKLVNQTGLNELGDLATIMKPSDIYYVPQEPSLAPQMQEWARSITSHGGPRPNLGLSSSTENKLASQLNTMIQDRVTRIMRGLDPLSALDGLISDWRKQGGDQIAKEYSEAAQKLQH